MRRPPMTLGMEVAVTDVRLMKELEGQALDAAGRAEETERRGRLSEKAVAELSEAGVFRLLQPARYGGGEVDPRSYFEVIRELSAACGSTGWVASVLGVHAWHLALFPEAAQKEVWGRDPEVLTCSSYAPTGKVRVVPGGYRISGRWSFSSGCDHAEWALLGGSVVEGGTAVDLCTFLVPSGDYEIDPVWDTVGLRGTGSNDLVVEDAFVPDHRVLSFKDTTLCRVPGQEVNTAPLYRIPFGSLFPYAVAAPVIGMATGVYREHVEYSRNRVRAVERDLATAAGKKANEDPTVQLGIAEAACDIDASWLQLERNFSSLMERARDHALIPVALRTAIRRDQAAAVRRSVRAADLLFGNSGGRALRSGGRIQRLWRDAHAGSAHAYNDHDRTSRLFGRSELGLNVREPVL